MGITSFLNKSCKSVAHIGSKHRKQAVSAIRVCHQLENLDLSAQTPPETKEKIMIQVQEIVQITYRAVQAAASPTKSVVAIEHQLGNIAPQVKQCITNNQGNISRESVSSLAKEVEQLEKAKKQDEDASRESEKLQNRVLNVVQKSEKPSEEHDFYLPGTPKRSNQHLRIHLDESAKLPDIVWRFQRKYRLWYPNFCISNPHFYPEVTSSHLQGGKISPLSDYNGYWTRTINVIGDDLSSRFKLEDSDNFFVYEPVKNLTTLSDVYFFKDANAHLHPQCMIEADLRRADGLTYYFWEDIDRSFIKAYKVRTIGELVVALNSPKEVKDRIRLEARDKSRAGTLDTTISQGAPRVASTRSATVPTNMSLTSTEPSTRSPRTSSDTALDLTPQSTTLTSESMYTPTHSERVSPEVVQSPASQTSPIVGNVTTSSVSTRAHSNPRTTRAAASTPAFSSTASSVASSTTITSSRTTETGDTLPASSAAGTLRNATRSKPGTAQSRGWWQRWVQPVFSLVTGTTSQDG